MDDNEALARRPARGAWERAEGEADFEIHMCVFSEFAWLIVTRRPDGFEWAHYDYPSGAIVRGVYAVGMCSTVEAAKAEAENSAMALERAR